ncbi:MAG: ribosome maturation factor RimP [Microthrixaceae bacterium]|nr:ribosome maturation factor RimP [Microthrixaceae bacterium]
MTPTEQTMRELVAPIARELDLQIYDIEAAGGVVRVLLDKVGGIDMGSITDATKRISRALDSSDPISGSYTLEVSSPGIERTLRVATHYEGAIGQRVKVKTKPDSGFDRRFGAVLESFQDPVATFRTDAGEAVEIPLGQIERVRTEFVDTAAPKPGKGPGKGSKSKSQQTKTTQGTADDHETTDRASAPGESGKSSPDTRSETKS